MTQKQAYQYAMRISKKIKESGRFKADQIYNVEKMQERWKHHFGIERAPSRHTGSVWLVPRHKEYRIALAGRGGRFDMGDVYYVKFD